MWLGFDKGKLLLRNFNPLIEAGETVTIVGQSGGGASTAAALLLRLYNLAKGSIFIDNRNICDFTIQRWPHFAKRNNITNDF